MPIVLLVVLYCAPPYSVATLIPLLCYSVTIDTITDEYIATARKPTGKTHVVDNAVVSFLVHETVQRRKSPDAQELDVAQLTGIQLKGSVNAIYE